MAETLVSPGVLQRENDRSFVASAPVEVGAALVGPTVTGPVEIPTIVTSFGDYREKFGTTFLSGSNQYEFLTSISAQKYFAEGGRSLLVTRVTPGDFTSATSTRILANSGSVTGVLATASLDFGGNLIGPAEGLRIIDNTSQNVEFIIVSGSTTNDLPNLNIFTYTGNGLQQLVNEINGTAGLNTTLSASLNGTIVGFSGSAAGAGLNGFTIQTGSTADLATLTTSSLTDVATFGGGSGTITGINNDNNISFTLKTIGEGLKFNSALDLNPDNIQQLSDSSLSTGSEDNLRWEVSNTNNNQGTFALTIRRGDDNLRSKTILETYTGLSLDPKADNYIEKLIGNQFLSVDTTTDPTQPLIKLNGDFPTRSRYIFVSSVNKQTPDYFNSDGTVNTDGTRSYSASLPLPTSGAFANGTGDILPSGTAGLYFENIGSGTSAIQGLSTGDYTQAVKILKNTDDFRFNLISAPGINYKDHATTFNSLVELAEDRGDTFFVGDLVGYGETIANVTLQTNNLNSSFAGSYWPWVKTRSAELSRDVFTPASTVMPGVYAYNDRVAAPWFAPAGLNRGGLNVNRAEVKLTSGMRDTLYDARVNPIATFPRNGVVAFGQKTLQKKSSALDRINVRRLLIALKNFVGDTAKGLVFEQNTSNTRNRFLNVVNPYLESVQQKQGLYAFRVVMDESNNSPDVIDRNQLVGQVLLQPTKTAEFVILDFTILPTGATFGE
tara:strand:- start:410 stop:2578 length:2169 start_codon:yes stop_codon:yes gene_type:complete